jgi:hypothetical protein
MGGEHLPGRVQVRRSGATMSLRNSEYPSVSVFFSPTVWKEFVESIKAGEFDSISVLGSSAIQDWEESA